MSLRFLLPALAAGLLLAPLASAQPLRSASPASGTAIEMSSATQAPLSAPVPSAARGGVPCTAGTTIGDPFSAASTTVEIGDPRTTAAGSLELGQSFVVPCDGLLSVFTPAVSSTVDDQTLTIRATFFDGVGTGGPVLTTSTGSFTLGAAGGYFINFTLPAFAVTQGQNVTVFFDVLATSAELGQFFNSPGGYADGTRYQSTTGAAADATSDAGLDLLFEATFDPSTTVVSGPFFNPSSAESDGAGWRLLSSPVSGVSLTALAAQNLVQGVSAGADPNQDPAQYPDVDSNVLLTYGSSPAGYFDGDAGGGTDFTAPRGLGYFWYFYDRDITPDPTSEGTGTSESVELTGFTLTATGAAAEADVSQPYYFPSADGEYLLGNPFADPFQLSGLTESTAGTVGTVFQVWDPSVGSFVTLAPRDFVAPWQGFFATSTTTAATPTFDFAFASTDDTATPTFYGRSGASDEAAVRFRLDGDTEAGTTTDLAATVRFVEGAAAGPDIHDGGKILPPSAPYALVAPVDMTGDAARHLAVNSLPATGEAVTVPVAFQTTSAGTFTLTWENTLETGRTAILRDLATGTETDLADATEYAFAAEAGDDWTERFELVMSVSVSAEDGPTEALLSAVAPNPAAGAAALTLRVPTQQAVRATLLDALGREVAVLLDAEVAPSAGARIAVDTASLAPGVYVVRVEGDTFAETRRFTVVR